MIQHLTEDDTWLLDYSTIYAYQQCRKLFQLRHMRNLVPNRVSSALDMGGAFHAGIEAYRLGASSREIVGVIARRGRDLPFDAMESKRSIENCALLVERWINHWEEPTRRVYKVAEIPWPTGSSLYWTPLPDSLTCINCGCYVGAHSGSGVCPPLRLVESTHRALLCTYPYRIIYVMKMDAVMQHLATGEYWVDELKTTSRLDSRYMEQVKPNHQGTGYVWGAIQMLGRKVAGWILDASLVAEYSPNSRRKPEDFFARNSSRRDDADIEEWRRDTAAVGCEIIDRVVSERIEPGSVRWNRSAPHACHQYDGCSMRPICRNSEDANVIASDYHEEQWDLLKMDNTERKA